MKYKSLIYVGFSSTSTGAGNWIWFSSPCPHPSNFLGLCTYNYASKPSEVRARPKHWHTTTRTGKPLTRYMTDLWARPSNILRQVVGMAKDQHELEPVSNSQFRYSCPAWKLERERLGRHELCCINTLDLGAWIWHWIFFFPHIPVTVLSYVRHILENCCRTFQRNLDWH